MSRARMSQSVALLQPSQVGHEGEVELVKNEETGHRWLVRKSM
jgi:hypothetical protein